LKSQEIREVFLDYFQSKGHKIIKSSSLLPKDDPSILFTNAGMNQFKNIFLGLEKKSYKRAASVQKCMRVSGKHNDLEQVGKSNKHHTFFEMLGNFSFGNYFKKEAIGYAWDLITEVYNFDKEKLFFTVYEKDDEAYQIWNEGIGVPSERIFRFGKKDNYWAMGEVGPCGPCSEIHYDLGSKIEEGDPYTLIENGSSRFSELWNLVFMQFHQDEKGKLHPLPSPSIDTGMGLERMAAALQSKKDNFDTDLFVPICEAISHICHREYPSQDELDVSVRIIADHIRAVTFMIGDGIMPSNEGRGYVLRRLIRRAFRNGLALGLEEPFFYTLVGVVCDIMKDAYPELLSSSNYISKICLSEERRFSLTLSSGLKTFKQYLSEAKDSKQNVIPGSKLFKLYDTFGFPVDLSKELAEEVNMKIDEKGFQKELEKQRQRARLSWKGDASRKDREIYEKIKGISTQYVGYQYDKITEANVLAILRKSKMAEELKEGESGEVMLDSTPFYAEAGGQIGDSGVLKNSHFSGIVESAYYPIPELIAHKIQAISGKIRVGDSVEASIDILRRGAISKNHTATHLLHASLRQILGDHVKQAGSLVSPARLRFDFTHYAPINSLEMHQIESLVNEKIQANISVNIRNLTLEEGLDEGAIAIFEEKYGEKVRMISIEDFSKELCGGIHVHYTGEIGLFKVIGEASIAAGMRRIEALTGEAAINHIQSTENLLIDLQQALNSSRKDLLKQIEKLKESLKEKERESKSLRHKLANIKYQKDEEKIQKIKGISTIIQRVEGLNNAELRELADSMKQKLGSGVVILGMKSKEKVFVVSSVTKDLIKQIKADEIIKKIAPMIKGGGGGRPDFAQAGGTDLKSLDQVLRDSPSILETLFKRKSR